MEGSEAVRGDGPSGPCGLARERRGSEVGALRLCMRGGEAPQLVLRGRRAGSGGLGCSEEQRGVCVGWAQGELLRAGRRWPSVPVVEACGAAGAAFAACFLLGAVPVQRPP